MSYDFALERACTHEVVLETVQLAAGTLDTVRFPRPPSNQSVNVYVNGEMVPRTGLQSEVRLSAPNAGPYKIRAGKSDVLYLRIGSGMPRLIPLLPGRQKAEDLARDLSSKVSELRFGAEDGRLVIWTREHPAFSFPDPTWTDKSGALPTTARSLGALRELGLSSGRVVSSRQIFPSWTVEQDQESPLQNARIVRFSRPLRNRSPLIQLGYFTEAAYCRRCHGSRFEYDYGVVNGTYESIDGTDLLVQEFDKFLFTRRGSHFKWPWLGSSVLDRIGGKNIVTGASSSAMITVDISQAFRAYQDIKSQQDQQRFQKVSDDEFPSSLTNLTVKVSPDDPTVAVVVVELTSRSRSPAPIKRLVSDPNPFLLSGGQTSFRLRG